MAGESLRRPAALLLVPALAWAASYLYLAAYHGRLGLIDTVVHESGRYTLLETTLYASHFLGHIPVLVVLTLLFVGACRALAPEHAVAPSRRAAVTAAAALLVLVAAAAVLSVTHFSLEDTLAYIGQQRQRADGFENGGSWNLHLPSTVLLFALVPPYVAAFRAMLGLPVVGSRRGLGLIASAALLTLVTTWVVSGGLDAALGHVWTDPRYLAHSVRELATFPVTYFPLALAALLAREPAGPRPRPSRRLLAVLVTLAVSFVAGLLYQSVVALCHDIGALAQRPDFACGGRLGVPYLLASHSFEHVLDSLFFVLACVGVAGMRRHRR